MRWPLTTSLFLATACTSVITEVAWHEESTFRAEVEFVAEVDWVNELTPLLEDIKDLGTAALPKRSPELQAAWNKVNTLVINMQRFPLTALEVLCSLPRLQGQPFWYQEHHISNKLCA